MKKTLALLGLMITCIFGLTACGAAKADVTPWISEAEAIEYGQGLVESLNTIVVQGAENQYAADPVSAAALSSWKNALEDMGSYIAVTGVESEIGEDEAVINAYVDGSVRDAIVEIIIDKEEGITSITTNVQYSFGEMMEKAALNTLIGMGTVFVVLILISFIISAFNLIPKFQEAFKKKEKPVDAKGAAVDNTIAQIIEKEELSDDLELVAVIAAAIAASEGQASTDGFVVRSIRRR